MRTRRRYVVLIAVAAVAGVVTVGVALAATSSTFSFKASPSKAPKNKYKAGSLYTDLETHYTNPGNAQPGGAVDRTQLYLDKNWKTNPKAAKKCAPQQLANQTMAGAMKNCKKALVGRGTNTATANGKFEVKGCVLLFNGVPQGGKPTLQVFSRVQASNPSNISCSNPSSNTQGNATILLTGVYKKASGKYGLVLDVKNIVAAATFPLVSYKTTTKHGDYASARCAAANHLWHMKVVWTYNNGAKDTETQSQKCKVKR
jgi:hypothetical protein